MKKFKKVIIKHPTLRNLRNNLRKIIDIWELTEEKKLSDKMQSLDWKSPQWRELRDTQNQLRRLLNLSICVCDVCQAQDKDMVFDPFVPKWMCVDCHEVLIPKYKDPRVQAEIHAEADDVSLEEFKATMQKNFGIKEEKSKRD